MSYLKVDHLSKAFPAMNAKSKDEKFVVFKNVNFDIKKGEFLTMIGHSGCGKSTLLNILAGFDRPTEGGVVLEGRETVGAGLDRMVVFQNFALMPWLTSFDNVRLAVAQAHPDWSRQRVLGHTQKYIDMMNLSGAESKRPIMLSGGMRQRVGLARAFAVEPKLLLLDEPFAQIDALTRGSIQEELVRMWQSTRNTVFMVTHDVDEAILLSDRIALMTNGPEAELAEIIEVDIPRPRNREQLIDEPSYTRIRNHILHFLLSGAKRPPSKPEKSESDDSSSGSSKLATLPGSNSESETAESSFASVAMSWIPKAFRRSTN